MRERIRKHLASDFERELFNGAMTSLGDVGNPLRFNNFAYATRELVRHILRRLAPDVSVVQCSWYKNEMTDKEGVTRRQRVYYAVQGGLSDHYVGKELELDIKDLHQTLRSAIDSLSKYTHVEPSSIALIDAEVTTKVDCVLDAVAALFDTIEHCRKALTDALVEHLDRAVVDEALSETIQAIDELSTHHFIDEVYTDEVSVLSIDHERIHFMAEGTIAYELQWGSNSDAKNGDALIVPQTFPFRCELQSPVDEPSDIAAVEESFGVDNSSWRDGYYDEA
jgi:hypothetical protein